MRALCVLISLIDALQVVFLGKGLGALGGCFLYGLFFVLVPRWKPALVVVGWMPLVPLTAILVPTLRAAVVDAPMLGVAILQVLASGGAWVLLRAGGEDVSSSANLES